MGRIIVVEDNLTFSGYVCRLLKSKGFQAVSASTCNGAHKLFAKMCEDDIVLADLRLNDGDGILLLDELRKQGKRSANRRPVDEVGCGGLYPEEAN